ncbi:type II secretion system protein GspL [Thioalkalivibrio sp. XN8]|uniref:type II secretion system protein GspL n=1 Tax=Thioalkalivibrio sp. XN8 TaxID=2712863 RepID=UPI0013EA5C03|nr:type II secretion system protein GspL [Thioalkalivibrio sp. XN8]NGP54666.1 type II secretion system protein GspL [Thioalkalivibrio sp. XN8]
MTETLVIRLDPADQERGSWVAVDAEGRRIGAPGAGALADAAAAAAGRRVAVLVPAEDVLLTRAELPVRGAGKILKALPFALEEQIAEDIEALHFAAGRLQGRTVPAAAVDREQLEGWLAAVQAAGLEPQLVCSEAEGCPAAPNHLNWLLDEHRCLARSGDGIPLLVEVAAVEDALRYGPGFPGDAEQARHLSVYVTPAAMERHGAALEALREQVATVEIRLLPDGVLPHLAAGIVARAPINLLQGPFAPRTQVDRLWRPWQAAAALLAVLAVVVLARQGLELMQLQREEARLDAAIAAAFQQALPGARMEDPRFQVERRLAALRGTAGAGDAGFLEAIETVGGALAGNQGLSIESVSYRSGVLDLKLVAPSVEALEAFRQAMIRDGRYAATIQQADPRGDGVEGRIQLTGEGA